MTIYEIGIVFRGFILVSHEFAVLPKQPSDSPSKDLRGAFIAAITSFVESCFTNTSLEYLESGDVLFIFKISEVIPRDSQQKEPVIMYGLVEKRKRPDRIVKKFLEKTQPLLQNFVYDYSEADFTEISQFTPFKEKIKRFFEK